MNKDEMKYQLFMRMMRDLNVALDNRIKELINWEHSHFIRKFNYKMSCVAYLAFVVLFGILHYLVFSDVLISIKVIFLDFVASCTFYYMANRFFNWLFEVER